MPKSRPPHQGEDMEQEPTQSRGLVEPVRQRMKARRPRRRVLP